MQMLQKFGHGIMVWTFRIRFLEVDLYFFIFTYLFQRQWKGKIQTDRAPIHSSLPKYPLANTGTKSQTKARSLELSLDLSYGWQGPNSVICYPLPPRVHIAGNKNQEILPRDSNLGSATGAISIPAGILTAMPINCPGHTFLFLVNITKLSYSFPAICLISHIFINIRLVSSFSIWKGNIMFPSSLHSFSSVTDRLMSRGVGWFVERPED